MTEAEERSSRKPKADDLAPRFVELIPTQQAGPGCNCLVEVEDTGGAKLRIELRAVEGTVIGAMARAFVEGHRT
jgi:hypothetical protein